MELLRIEGSRAALLGLREVPELQVIGSSAIDRGDGSWLVSAYAPDEAAIERLRERRLVVHRVKVAEQVRAERATAAAAPVGYPIQLRCRSGCGCSRASTRTCVRRRCFRIARTKAAT